MRLGSTAVSATQVTGTLGNYALDPREIGVVNPAFKKGDVRRYGVASGVDCTTQFQNAIDSAKAISCTVLVPDGLDTIITQTLNVYLGTRIRGASRYHYGEGFGVVSNASRITFTPAVTADLFVYSGESHVGARFHTGIVGLTLVAGNNNARYGIVLNGVIDSQFRHISSDGSAAGAFDSTIRCDGTIDNEFSNIYATGRTACVSYAGNSETTDVWHQCTFTRVADGTPCLTGVAFNGLSWAVRFIGCKWEALENEAIRQTSDTHSIMVDNCYGENVPNGAAADGCVFRIGASGSVAPGEIAMMIVGGRYYGRDAGVVGSIINSDYCAGVMVSSVGYRQFTRAVKTTLNTRIRGIHVGGGFVGQHTIEFCNDEKRIDGAYPRTTIGNNADLSGSVGAFDKVCLLGAGAGMAVASLNAGELCMDGDVIRFKDSAGVLHTLTMTTP